MPSQSDENEERYLRDQSQALNSLSDVEMEAIESAIERTLRMPGGQDRFAALFESLGHVLQEHQPPLEPAYLITAIRSDSSEDDASVAEGGWSGDTRSRIMRLRLIYGYWLGAALDRDMEDQADWNRLIVSGHARYRPDGSTQDSLILRITRNDEQKLVVQAPARSMMGLVVTIMRSMSELSQQLLGPITPTDAAELEAASGHLISLIREGPSQPGEDGD